MMLLRLSRVSFWLATAVAAWALVAPGGHETVLMAIVLVASALAFGLWRSALRAGQRAHVPQALVPDATPLDEPALRDAAALLVRSVTEAASFEASLHAAARVLRAELGAREASAAMVNGLDATHARLSGLIESQPGFRMAPRRVRLDALPLGRALRDQREASDSLGSCAVPVRLGGQVVAVVELAAIGVAVEPAALAGLLGLACAALSARAETQPESEPAPGLGAGALVHPQPAEVLVVDDNVLQLEETTRMLGRLGCRVVTASGMLEGLHALCRAQFDVVLIDPQVSGMGGAEGLNWLRCNPGGVYNFVSRRDTPVIALTDPGVPADRECFRELGFDDQLSKPLRQDQMIAMLSKHLRLHAAASERGGAAMAHEAGPVLDPAALARLTELDPTGSNRLLERVLQAFQTSAARLWPQAEAARLSGDRATLRLVAHTLKSSSASIGAMHLSQLCAQVETAIRLDAPDDLGAILDAMGAALHTTLQAIAQLLEARG
jgi:CheY-like chemotaxis protein/HPt (histidine-containing phosphotransfer) domain-containing protein